MKAGNEGLRVGSTVLVVRATLGDTLTKIARETKTLWITENGGRFRKDDLYASGSTGYERSRIVDVESEHGQRHLRLHRVAAAQRRVRTAQTEIDRADRITLGLAENLVRAARALAVAVKERDEHDD